MIRGFLVFLAFSMPFLQAEVNTNGDPKFWISKDAGKSVIVCNAEDGKVVLFRVRNYPDVKDLASNLSEQVQVNQKIILDLSNKIINNDSKYSKEKEDSKNLMFGIAGGGLLLSILALVGGYVFGKVN